MFRHILLALAAVASALTADPVIYKLDEERYQYVTDDNGNQHLVDLWVKTSDLKASTWYNADNQNIYHLYTRTNPSQSQLMVFGCESILSKSNFKASRRTAVIIHGWQNNATSVFNTVLIKAFLVAEDMNVFVVDWNAGAATSLYPVAVANTKTSGESVARFLTWVNYVTGAKLSSYHIVGHSLGGHQAGIVGRNLGGAAAYITSLDPAFPGWVTNSNRFKKFDGVYTEVIHTCVGKAGYLNALGQTDFYPNEGGNMPGCDSISCNHHRAFHYFAESLTSGGFTGSLCQSLTAALRSTCGSPLKLKMGGLTPKTGAAGIYHLTTNAAAPYSRG